MTSAAPITSATVTGRKPRSLADLAEEQVKAGALDPNDLNKPVDWSRRNVGPPRTSSYNSTRRWDEGGVQTEQVAGGDSLNWQQRELLSKEGGGSGRTTGFNRRGGEGMPSQRYGGSSSDRSYDQRQSGATSPSAGPQRRDFAKPKGPDIPEWATDLDTSAPQGSSLNWQQKSLITRDESNPFNRLVRGEDEYYRE